MRKEFESVHHNTVFAIMRAAHWDPQSHNKDGFTYVKPHISAIIDALDSKQGAIALRKIRKSAALIADFLNNKKYYNSAYNGEPINKDAVEDIMRKTLEDHFTMPAPLKLVHSID